MSPTGQVNCRRTETVAAIDALYKALEDKPLVAELRARGAQETLTLGMQLERLMPAWLRGDYFGLQGWQWSALIVLISLGLAIRKSFPALVHAVAGPLLLRKIAADREVQRRAFDASGILAGLVVWLFAIQHLQLPGEFLGFLLPVSKFLVTLSIVFTGYRLVDVLGEQLVASREIQLTAHDELLIPLLRKVLRLLVSNYSPP
ncbi:MAG: hypothetical protein GY792_02365 [Gammaproteobacteria bacterium]|nr:hypothetical protein [Gammaproteobacteria bacterium]